MKPLRHRLEYWAVVAVRWLVRWLPRGLSRALGSAIGLAFYGLDGPHRRLAQHNLRRAFPLRTPRECGQLAREVFAHFGRLLVELLYFSTLAPEAMRRLVEIDGRDRVEQAYGRGRGVLFVTGHFGFWEIHALAHGALIRPIGVLARALDNPYLNRMLEQVRSRTGNTVIYRRGALRRILKELSRNRGVAVLIDQHIHGGDRVWVDFFDRPAATTSAVAALALRTGAPVIPVFALPLADGRYRLIYEHPVEPPAPDDPEAVRLFTQRCTDVLEMYVRRYPQLWLWMHRRWREDEEQGVTAGVGGMFPAAQPDDE